METIANYTSACKRPFHENEVDRFPTPGPTEQREYRTLYRERNSDEEGVPMGEMETARLWWSYFVKLLPPEAVNAKAVYSLIAVNESKCDIGWTFQCWVGQQLIMENTVGGTDEINKAMTTAAARANEAAEYLRWKSQRTATA